MSSTALARTMESSDFLEPRRDRIEDLITFDGSRILEKWLAYIDPEFPPVPWIGACQPGFTYTVYACTMQLTLDGSGRVTAVAVPANTGDLTMSGKAYNLYEVRNLPADAEGEDTTEFPGSYALLPCKNFVECFHLRMSDGSTVIAFMKRNPQDGDCDS